MKRNVLVLAIVALALLVALWLWRRSRGESVAVDLVAQFPTAEKRAAGPLEVVFQAGEQQVAGERKSGIFMHPTSRLIYKGVLIPEDARLRAWIGVKDDAWDKPGDGVLFRFGVSDGRDYEELFNQHVDPANNSGDRKWIPVDVDLSAYSGRQVDLIFNTNTSPPNRGDNSAYDFAVWGTPQLVVRQ
jgi:hypothetical protein